MTPTPPPALDDAALDALPMDDKSVLSRLLTEIAPKQWTVPDCEFVRDQFVALRQRVRELEQENGRLRRAPELVRVGALSPVSAKDAFDAGVAHASAAPTHEEVEAMARREIGSYDATWLIAAINVHLHLPPPSMPERPNWIMEKDRWLREAAAMLRALAAENERLKQLTQPSSSTIRCPRCGTKEVVEFCYATLSAGKP